MRGAQRIRNDLGRPVEVTRGVSCAAHNAALGGAPDSRHLPRHADAIDIACASPRERYEVVFAAMKNPAWTAIRVYAGHVHLDQRPGPRIFIASPE